MLRLLAVIGTAVVPLAGQAQFTDRNKTQAQCELSAIRDTRSSVAIAWIRTACNWLAMNTGSLNESNRRFYGGTSVPANIVSRPAFDYAGIVVNPRPAPRDKGP